MLSSHLLVLFMVKREKYHPHIQFLVVLKMNFMVKYLHELSRVQANPKESQIY